MNGFYVILTIIMFIIIVSLLLLTVISLIGYKNTEFGPLAIGEDIISVSSDIPRKSLFYRFIKRFNDVVFGSILCIIFSPIMLMLYVPIRMEDGGPATYRRQCIGYKGKTITYSCFRTMRIDPIVDLSNNEFDTRITRIGRVIRPLGLDYLPMLGSVVSGKLTLVGLARIHPVYAQVKPFHKHLFDYEKPGLIGLSTVTLEKDMDKEKADLVYLQKRGVWSDIKIIAYAIRNTFITSSRSEEEGIR